MRTYGGNGVRQSGDGMVDMEFGIRSWYSRVGCGVILERVRGKLGSWKDERVKVVLNFERGRNWGSREKDNPCRISICEIWE